MILLIHSFVFLLLFAADDYFNARDVGADLVDKDLEVAEGEKGDHDANGIIRQQQEEGGSLGENTKVDNAQQHEAPEQHSQLKTGALEIQFEVALDNGSCAATATTGAATTGKELLGHCNHKGGDNEGHQNPVPGTEVHGKDDGDARIDERTGGGGGDSVGAR
jgi:hypothetical protein